VLLMELGRISVSAAAVRSPLNVDLQRRLLYNAVGEFRALVDVAERDRALCDTLKRVLKLSKASRHASRS
jgi:hypothetical protein